MRNLSKSRLSLTEIFEVARANSVLQEIILVLALLLEDGKIFLIPGKEQRKGIFMVEKWVADAFVPGGEHIRYCWENSPTEYELEQHGKWLRKNGDFFDIDCAHSDFKRTKPFRQGKLGGVLIAETIRMLWAGESRSDFVALVSMMRMFHHSTRQQLGCALDSSVLTPWCSRHFVNSGKIKRAYELIVHWQRNNSWGDEDPFQERDYCPSSLVKVLAWAFPDNIWRVVDEKQRQVVRIDRRRAKVAYGSLLQPRAESMAFGCGLVETEGLLTVAATLSHVNAANAFLDAFPDECVEKKVAMRDIIQGKVIRFCSFMFGSVDMTAALECQDEESAKYFAAWLWMNGADEDLEWMDAELREVLLQNLMKIRKFFKKNCAVIPSEKLEEGIETFYVKQLQGACSVQQALEHIEALRLPEIESDEFRRIFS